MAQSLFAIPVAGMRRRRRRRCYYRRERRVSWRRGRRRVRYSWTRTCTW